MNVPTAYNNPSRTWKQASYEPPTERREKVERRNDPRRATVGERRKRSRRSLRSLLRL